VTIPATTWAQPAGAPLPPPPPPPPGVPGDRRTRVPWWGLGDVGISLLVWLGVQIVFAIVVVVLGVTQDDLEDPSAQLTLALVAVTWVGFLTWPLIAMRWKGTGRPDLDFGLAFKPIDVAWAAAGFAAFWAFNFAATVAFTLVADGEPPTNTDMVDSATTSTGSLLLLVVAVGLVTPVVEELWFRGFLLRAIGKRFGAPIAVVVSSVAFGLPHAQFEGIGDLWLISMLTVYGLILALLTVRNQGRLGAAIICHAINNTIAVLVVGLG
jgi:membrane protease YdiL (CAAX protease family)